jgi:hypothetical protein
VLTWFHAWFACGFADSKMDLHLPPACGYDAAAAGLTSEKKQDLSAWNSVLQQPFST